MRLKRVRFVARCHDRKDRTIACDVALDDNGKIKKPGRYFGCEGPFEDGWPFVLFPERETGQINLGRDMGQAQFSTANELMQIPIKVGEKFEVFEFEDDLARHTNNAYVITHVEEI